MAARFEMPFGALVLDRRPPSKGDQLLAWDGADALLLETLHGRVGTAIAAPVLVINDTFGALAIALAAWQPVSWGDSRLGHLALASNLRHNGHAPDAFPLPATGTPAIAPATVLWRVPKSLALFEQQLARLFPKLRSGARVLVGGMDKHLPPQTQALLEKVGEVVRLPGRRKAHVFEVTPDPARPAPTEPISGIATLSEHGIALTGDANVFAAHAQTKGSIDIGARFFIEQFGLLPEALRIADLGCGNGILGLIAQRCQPHAEITFFDESYQAVASAERNYHANMTGRSASPPRFIVDDGMSSYDGPPFELVLCNPPFHQGHVVGDHIARRLFRQAHQHLAPGGELWVVGNRHLRYEQTLSRLFRRCRRVADNRKFTVLAATR